MAASGEMQSNDYYDEYATGGGDDCAAEYNDYGGGGDDFGKGGKGGGFGRRRDDDFGGEPRGDAEKPKETYVPEDVEDDDLFKSTIGSGMNFDKYDSIPVKVIIAELQFACEKR